MPEKILSWVWASEHNESAKVDKVWKYLDQLFDPKQTPNGIFLYDRWDPQTENNGASKFAKVVASPAYKAFKDNEIELYREEKDWVKHRLEQKHARNIIDIWCGDWLKSAYLFFDILGKSMKDKTYIGADISPYNVAHARANVQDYFHKNDLDIKTSGMSMNFLESDTFKDLKHKAYFFLGWSIGNFSDEEIVTILQNMASENAFGLKSNIFMTFFEAPDKDDENYEDNKKKMLAAYGDPDTSNPYFDKETHDLTKDWIMSGFASLGIDTNKLEFTVTYDEENNRVLSGAKVKEQILVKHEWKNYVKEPGEFLRAIQSRRFTKGKIEELAKKAWAHSWNPHSRNGMVMATIEAARSAEWKKRRSDIIKSRSKAALIATLLTAGVFWGMKYQQHVQTKEKQKQSEEITRRKFENKELFIPYTNYLWDSLKSDWVIDELHKTVNDLYDDLVERYGANKVHEDEIKNLLVDIVENEWKVFLTRTMNEAGRYGYSEEYHPRRDYVDEIVSRYAHILHTYGVSEMPYEWMQKYTYATLHTFMYQGKAELIDTAKSDNEKTYSQAARWGAAVNPNIDIDKPLVIAWFSYDLQIKKVKWVEYLLAKPSWYDDRKYSLEIGQQVALRILMEWNAPLHSFIETYKHYHPNLTHMGVYAKEEAMKQFIQTVLDRHDNLFPDHISKSEIHEIIRSWSDSTANDWVEAQFNRVDTGKNDLTYPDYEPGWEPNPDQYYEMQIYEMPDGTQYKLADLKRNGKSYAVAKKIIKYKDDREEFTTENANLVINDYRKYKASLKK